MTMIDLAPALHSTHDAEGTGLALQLVAGTYLTPGEPLRSDLASGAFTAAIQQLATVAKVEAPTLAQPDVAALQSEYVSLFVTSAGGLPAPPYAGYAVDDALLGPTAQRLKGFYDVHGITPNATWADLPDHVSAVAEAGVLLLDSGRPEAARTLLARFLSPWFARFAPVVEARDENGFYGPMTGFLHAAIREVTRESPTDQS